MTTSFPTSLDTFVNPDDSAGDTLASVPHDAQHAHANDSIAALETKVGVNGSAVTSSLDYKVAQNTANIATNTSNIATNTASIVAQTLTPAQGLVVVAASGTSGTAINAAIAALPASGGTVLLAAGTHVINTAVLINKSVILAGVGISTTLLSFDGGVVTTAIAMADTTQRQVHLRDFRINTTTASDNTGTAIDASYFFDSAIERVLIGSSSNQTPNVGIKFNALGTYYNSINDCRIVVGGASSVGVLIGNNANDNAVRNSKISGDASTTSIQINTAHSTVIDHVSSDTAAMAIGFDLQTLAHDTTMIGCYLEGLTIGLKVASGVEAVRYIGGYIASSVTANIQDNGAVSLTVDNSWVAFDPYSSIDRTGVVKNKINGSAVPGNGYQPDDFSGIIAWDYDPVHIQAGVAAANGTVYLMGIKLRYAATITNLMVSVTAAGVTPVAGQSFLGLYNSSGTLVGVTADVGTALTTPGLLTAALTVPYAAAAGSYWVGLVSNAATPPQLARASTLGLAGTFTLGSTAATRRYATNGAGATALANITPASNSAAGLTFWVAVS